MEVVRTLQVAKQLDFLGGNNLAGALASLTGGGGKENFHYRYFVTKIGETPNLGISFFLSRD